MAEQKDPDLRDYPPAGDNGIERYRCNPHMIQRIGRSLAILSDDMNPDSTFAQVCPDEWNAEIGARQARWDALLERFRLEVVNNYTLQNILPDDQIQWLDDWIDAISCLTPGVDIEAIDTKYDELRAYCKTLMEEREADLLARAEAAAAATGREFKAVKHEHYDGEDWMVIYWD